MSRATTAFFASAPLPEGLTPPNDCECEEDLPAVVPTGKAPLAFETMCVEEPDLECNEMVTVQQYAPQVTALVVSNRTSLIVGPTGCGKST